MSYLTRFTVTGSVCPSSPIFGQRAAHEVRRLAGGYDQVVLAEYPQPNTPGNTNIDPGIIRINIKQGNQGKVSFSSFNLKYKTIKITLANVGQLAGCQKTIKPVIHISKPSAPFTAGKHKDKKNSIIAILLKDFLKPM